LQSVLGQSGHEGSILAKQTYSSFGSLLSQTGLSNNTQKYTGREIDKETGLYNYRNRIYDPTIGRFISEDPKGSAAGINFYSYCFNNPIICNDPSGLDIVVPAGPNHDAITALLDRTITEMQKTVVGRDVLNNAMIPSLTITIQTSNLWEAFPDGTLNVNLGFTPKTLGYYPATQDWLVVQTSPERALAHELAHFMEGFVYDTGLGKMSHIDTYENPMFEPIDGYQRKTYSGLSNFPLGKASKYLIDEVFKQTRPLNITPSSGGRNSSNYSSGLINAINSTMGDINSVINPGSGLGSGLGTISVDLLGFGNSAAGGYVLYPSKPNNNMAQSVYHK
jgi:RHS repeat-associated protein